MDVPQGESFEPIQDDCIQLTVQDMTNYLSLFKEDQKLIFDLGNLIDDVYTGAFNITLTATFFNAKNTAKPADLILPVSKNEAAENMASVFDLSQDKAISSLTIPRNTKKAVFTVSATGQSNEEVSYPRSKPSPHTPNKLSSSGGATSPKPQPKLFHRPALSQATLPSAKSKSSSTAP